MKQKAGQQSDVLEKIHRKISLSEEKRRKLRFEYNLAALAGGSIQALGSDEFMTGLAEFLAKDSGKNDLTSKLFIALDQAVVHPDTIIRERSLAVLSLAARHSIQEQDQGQIVLLVHVLCKWMIYEQEVLPGLTVVINRLEELSHWLLQMGVWQEAAKIVTILFRIQCGELKKSSAIKSLVGKCLNKLATEQVVEVLTDGYLQHPDKQEVYVDILRSLGLPSTRLLLNRCMHSSDHVERQELLILVAALAGDAFAGLVGESLSQQLSGEALKDLISFAANSGGEVMWPVLQQNFAHEDRRVQHEMIRYAVKLGGRSMKDRLLAGLNVVHDSLKISIIRLLADHAAGDETVLSALCDFVDNRSGFAPDARQGLVRAIVVALRVFPHWRSIEVLGRLHSEYENLPEGDHFLLQIDRSLKILAPQLRHGRQLSNDAEEVAFDSDPLHRQLASHKVAKIEEEVRKILREGDGKGAGHLLYQHARLAGREWDFVTAEMLRDRILQVNPMALDEVVELGEWLEEQKKIVAEPLHREIWSGLCDLLAPVELKALHQVLCRENFRKGDIIIQAGESDESLYFLTAGHIGINCLAGQDKRFLRRMKPGDVLGSTQFFAASVWTYSLNALSDVQVYRLNRGAFLPAVEKYPELEQKLHRYCAKFETMLAEILKTTGDDRREFPRYPITRLVTNSLLDPYGTKESRSFNGELLDISRNGLAFTVKISDSQKARVLLGREIATVIQAEDQPIARCSGIVVSVRQQNAVTKDFSIHVKLAKQIDLMTFNRIISLIEKNVADC